MSSGIAVSIVPGELRLLVARTNGSVRPLHQLAAALPEDAIRSGLRVPNVVDATAVSGALSSLVAEAGMSTKRSGLLALLVPDTAVRIALVPLEGAEPRHSEGESMARWALRDMLPFDVDEARVDWSIVAEQADGASKWLLAVGADAGVIGEYESIVESLGWTADRVIPVTLALAVGSGESAVLDDSRAARLVCSGVGGHIACVVEAGGVPRLHRAWRGALPDLAAELRKIDRYVTQRLDRSIVEAALAGPESWQESAAAACRALGWTVHSHSSWSAHLGAVLP